MTRALGPVRELDVGDFARFEGRVWRTQKGELSVDARDAVLLAKSLRPLPEKWHGLRDVEARYRQRYLDLLANPEARRIAEIRSRTLRAMRGFLDARGFLEVETPALQPIYGGAAARPFTTHHDGYGQTLYLRISDELYLKRLVVGGLDLITKGTRQPKLKRYAENALAAAERGARLTGQLLAFSRVQRLEVRPTQVAGLIQNMRPLLKNVLGPGIEKKFDLHEETLAVLADPTQLEVAVLNLAINARDAMPEGGVLRFATAVADVEGDA